MPVFDDELRYKLLKLLADSPDMTQREIAATLNMSLGKANYCLRALIDKKMVRGGSGGRLPGGRHNTYSLTRKGEDERSRVTLRYFKTRQREYRRLSEELKELESEARALNQQNDCNH